MSFLLGGLSFAVNFHLNWKQCEKSLQNRSQEAIPTLNDLSVFFETVGILNHFFFSGVRRLCLFSLWILCIVDLLMLVCLNRDLSPPWSPKRKLLSPVSQWIATCTKLYGPSSDVFLLLWNIMKHPFQQSLQVISILHFVLVGDPAEFQMFSHDRELSTFGFLSRILKQILNSIVGEPKIFQKMGGGQGDWYGLDSNGFMALG